MEKWAEGPGQIYNFSIFDFLFFFFCFSFLMILSFVFSTPHPSYLFLLLSFMSYLSYIYPLGKTLKKDRRKEGMIRCGVWCIKEKTFGRGSFMLSFIVFPQQHSYSVLSLGVVGGRLMIRNKRAPSVQRFSSRTRFNSLGENGKDRWTVLSYLPCPHRLALGLNLYSSLRLTEEDG